MSQKTRSTQETELLKHWEYLRLKEWADEICRLLELRPFTRGQLYWIQKLSWDIGATIDEKLFPREYEQWWLTHPKKHKKR